MDRVLQTSVGLVNSNVHSASETDSHMRYTNAIILESVDETLGDLLGRNVREIVYDCLDKDRSIPRNEIPLNLDNLFLTLDEVFGKEVGKMISNEFQVKLCMKSGKSPKTDNIDYVDLDKVKLEK